MRNRLLKSILKKLIFLLLCLFTVLIISYLFRPVTISRKNICGFYAEEKESLDMVYIGGSACYQYWEGLQAWNDYGFTSYNVAADAIQPQVLKYLVREVQKTQTPELFVIDLRPFQYGDLYSEQENVISMERVAPFRNVSDSMKYSRNRFEMIQNCAPASESKWTYHFDLSKYHSLIASFVLLENWKYADNEEMLYNKGFWASSDFGRMDRYDLSAITEKQPLSDSLDVLFRDLLDYCKSKDLQVLFVVHVYQIMEEDQKKYNYMEDVIAEYGFDYLNVNDYYDEIGFDAKRDFYNMNHTNLLGADKYTRFLAQYIDENYQLPNHKGDEKYQQWDECYAQWSQEMEQIRETMVR